MMPFYAISLRQQYNRNIEKLEEIEKQLEDFKFEAKHSYNYRQHQYNRKHAETMIEKLKFSIKILQTNNQMLDASINAMCTYNHD